MTNSDKASLVTRLALNAGFDAVGIAPAGPIAHREYYERWLEDGLFGEMEYLARTRDLRSDCRKLIPGAKSVIVVAHNYNPVTKRGEIIKSEDGPRGRIARYAWGRDYHHIVRRKLQRMVSALRQSVPETFLARVCVDTAPVMERELAAAAGIGWIGRNTMLIHPRLGSFLFLGVIVTTLDIEPSVPIAGHCGSCRRCMAACPTKALTAPGRMDARRCIAYLTIEHRGAIPPDLQPLMGNWIFGCDVCQEVCPHNQKAPSTHEPAYGEISTHIGRFPFYLVDILSWTEERRLELLAGTAMKRARLDMFRRNASIALKNHREEPALKE